MLEAVAVEQVIALAAEQVVLVGEELVVLMAALAHQELQIQAVAVAAVLYLLRVLVDQVS
jgi:hypothetical protein